jgi:hypothetical protein
MVSSHVPLKVKKPLSTSNLNIRKTHEISHMTSHWWLQRNTSILLVLSRYFIPGMVCEKSPFPSHVHQSLVVPSKFGSSLLVCLIIICLITIFLFFFRVNRFPFLAVVQVPHVPRTPLESSNEVRIAIAPSS